MACDRACRADRRLQSDERQMTIIGHSSDCRQTSTDSLTRVLPEMASVGELSSELRSFIGRFLPHRITSDTSDTDLIVDKHESDSSECGMILSGGLPEEDQILSGMVY